MPSLTTTYNLLPSPSTRLSRQLQFTLTISTALSMLIAGSQPQKSQKRIEVWYPVENTNVCGVAQCPSAHPTPKYDTGNRTVCSCGGCMQVGVIDCDKGKRGNHASLSVLQALITQWNMPNQL
jgi:hypothetical protein